MKKPSKPSSRNLLLSAQSKLEAASAELTLALAGRSTEEKALIVEAQWRLSKAHFALEQALDEVEGK